MNPLDTGEEFQLEVMNPNPTSSKTKSGPVYRVSFELHKDDWQCFMDANTAGMILQFFGRATEIPSGIVAEESRPKGGPRSKDCAMLCQDPAANNWAGTKGYEDFKHLVYALCDIKSRAELDHDERALSKYETVKSEFLRYMYAQGGSNG